MIVLHFKVEFYRKMQGQYIQHNLKKAFVTRVHSVSFCVVKQTISAAQTCRKAANLTPFRRECWECSSSSISLLLLSCCCHVFNPLFLLFFAVEPRHADKEDKALSHQRPHHMPSVWGLPDRRHHCYRVLTHLWVPPTQTSAATFHFLYVCNKRMFFIKAHYAIIVEYIKGKKKSWFPEAWGCAASVTLNVANTA